MTKTLILGGAGFIGTYCLRYLLNHCDHHIVVIDNLARGRMDDEFKALLDSPRVQFIQANVTDPNVFTSLDGDFDFVYHLAAIVGVQNVLDRPDEVVLVNTLSTIFLLNWLKDNQRNLKRLLFTSTSEVYAETLRHQKGPIPTPESISLVIDPNYPRRSTYALSKIFGEASCMTYARKYGIPVTVIRPHNIYGPRMGYSHVIPEMLLRAASEEKELGVYSFNHSRSFCFVEDAVEAIVKLMETEEAREKIVNVGNSREELTIGELAKHIVDIVNPLLTLVPLAEQEGSPLRRCPNTTQLERLVQFTPKNTLRQGLEKTWAWYKNHQEMS